MSLLRRFATIVLLTFVAQCALAQDTFTRRGIHYRTNADGTATVTESGNQHAGVLEIPETVKYKGRTYTVTALGDNAFNYCIRLREIRLPQTVRAIGDFAFSMCAELERVVTSAPLEHIGKRCFQSCIKLSERPQTSATATVSQDAYINSPLNINLD